MGALPDGFVIDTPAAPTAKADNFGLPDGFIIDAPMPANPPVPPPRPGSLDLPVDNAPVPPVRPSSFGGPTMEADQSVINAQGDDAASNALKQQLPSGNVVQWGDKFYKPGSPTPIGSVPSLTAEQGIADWDQRYSAADQKVDALKAAPVKQFDTWDTGPNAPDMATQQVFGSSDPATKKAAAIKQAEAERDALLNEPIARNNASTDLTNRALKGAGQSALDVAKPFGQVAADLGAPGLKAGIQTAQESLPQTDPIRDKELASKVASGFGGAAPFVVGGALGAGIKTLGAAGALQGFGSQYEAVENAEPGNAKQDFADKIKDLLPNGNPKDITAWNDAVKQHDATAKAANDAVAQAQAAFQKNIAGLDPKGSPQDNATYNAEVAAYNAAVKKAQASFSQADANFKNVTAGLNTQGTPGDKAAFDKAKADYLARTQNPSLLPRYIAGTLGLLTGAAQSLPIARLFEQYAPGSTAFLKGITNQTLRDAATVGIKTAQGAIEFPAIQSAVTVGNNAIAQGLYDKNRDLFDGVRENASAAALVGAFLGFGAGMHNTAEGRAKIAGAAENFDWDAALGVKPDASPAEVKAAYYAKAKEAHPDNGGSTEAMQAVNAAYEVYKAKWAKENPQASAAPAPEQPQGQPAPKAPTPPVSGQPAQIEPPGSPTFARGPSDVAPPSELLNKSPTAAAPPAPSDNAPRDTTPQVAAENKALVQSGYDDEDIAAMSPKERAKALKDAQAAGVPIGGDTGANIPETPATLQAQQTQLAKGERPVVMYPKGTVAPDVPDGMKQIVTPRGTFHYNPDQITPQQIKKASAQGRENEILGLGPYNKADVEKATQPGETPQAVVERDPAGNEVRAAAGVAATIPEQQAAMEKGKSPGNTVTVEPIADVLSGRAPRPPIPAPPPGFIIDQPKGDTWSNQASPSSPDSSLLPSSSQAPGQPSNSGSSSGAMPQSASSTAISPTSKPLTTTTTKAPREGKPQSLIAFLRARGGVKDHGSDLRARDMHRRFPGLVNNKKGLDLDHAREIAAEAGYLGHGDAVGRTRVNDLLDAIHNHPVFTIHDQERVDAEAHQAARADEHAHYVENVEAEIRNSMSDAGIKDGEIPDDLVKGAAKIVAEEGMTWDDALESAAIRSVDAPNRKIIADAGVEIPFDDYRPQATAPGETSGSDQGAGSSGQKGNEPRAQGEDRDGHSQPARGDETQSLAEAGGQGESAGVKPYGWREGDQILSEAHGFKVGDPVTVKDRTFGPSKVTGLYSRDLMLGHPVAIAAIKQDSSGKEFSVNASLLVRHGASVEPGAEGKPQSVIPGAERITDAELAQNKADERLKPKKTQAEGVGGMFDEANTAAQLFDAKPESSEPKPAKAPASLADAVAGHLMRGDSFPNIVAARKFAKENGGDGLSQKQIEEAIEHGVVKAARHYVEKAKDPDQAYRDLTALYERQPILGTRTSNSVAMQAYSTPAPLAYLAAHLAGIGRNTTSVYEPTAGNGMLLITAPPSAVVANELGPERAAALKEQGFKVTTNDASDPAQGLALGKHGVDAVIANPPFGMVKDDEGRSTRFDLSDIQPGYKTNEIDHAIALRALTAMKPNGRAVLILGGINKLVKTGEGRSDAYNGKAKREFYKTLYDHYNVVDHFTAAGELYAKQGAGYPVDVIVIDGRGKSSLPLPSVSAPKVYNSWDELKEKLDAPRSGNEAAIDRPAGGNAGKPAAPAAASANEPHSAPVAGAEPENGKPGPVRAGRASDEPGKPVSKPDDARQSGDEERHVSGDAGGDDSAPPAKPRNRVAKKAEQETDAQVSYRPKSANAEALGTLVPTNMRFATEQALNKVAARHKGGIEALVGDRIGLKTDENGPYFVRDGERKYPLAAEQLDAAALAIDNMEKGSGFIIGDQTGLGKGRVNAAVIRYALKHGLTPIFVTEKPNLYGDMYRDLSDMGVQEMLGREPRILMTNSGENVPLDDEGKMSLKTAESKAHGELLRKVASDGKLKDHDALFTTYAQMQTVKGEATDRQRLLRALAPNAVLILDEAHNAGGTGPALYEDKNAPPNRAQFVRDLVQAAHGVFYSSATYAKRPDVMDLYSKTDMAKAVANLDELGPTIAAGGVPMQQAVAAMLAEAGQYIRREKSFAGITYDTPVTPVDREAYDHVSKSLAAIHRFSERIKAATKEINKELRAEAKAVSSDGATGGAGAASLNFTSIMHNLINQTLLGLKAVPAAQEAIAAIKRGEKPILTVANTMESFLNEYAADNGIKPGEPINLSFNDLLKRYLDRTRTITIKKPFMAKGEKAEKKYLTDAELGPAALSAYKSAEKIIGAHDLSGIPISPIDYIKNQIEKAGYTVGEITGRGQTLDYSTIPPTYQTRPQSERSIKGRRAAISGFNNGPIDCMIINQAGSTGLSMHASVNFKDQRQRHMMIVQAEQNIDTHFQMLGRPNRTGQVNLPRYTQMVADIPAEKRPAAVLAKKMASLNASTTASRGGGLSAKDTPDFMNEYGDRVAASLMIENPELNSRLGDPVSDDADSVDGAMRSVTGRIPLLPIKEQESLYDLLEENYRTFLAEKEQSGENALEAKRLDLDAKTLSTEEVVKGSGDSPFTRAVTAETIDAKRQGRPYKGSDVITDTVNSLGERRTAFADEDRAALPQIAEKGAAQAQRMGAAALDEFKGFSKDVLGAFESADARQAAQERFDVNEGRFRDLIRSAHVGAHVTLKGQEDNLTGVITKIFKSGKAQNPLALGSWKIVLAVPGQSPISLPFSKIATRATMPAGDAGDLYQIGAAPHEAPETLLTRFDAGAANMREKRVVLTGNILSAFNYAKKGQIVHFSDANGDVRQGVLLPKSVTNVADLTRSRPTPLKTPQEVLDHLNSSGVSVVSDRSGSVSLARQRDGRLAVMVPASKAEGGQYFLNRTVMAATEDQFMKRGLVMRAETPRYGDIKGNDLALIDALMNAGAKFQKPPLPQATRTPTVDIEPRTIAASNPAPRDDTRTEATRKMVDSLIDELLPKETVRAEVHDALRLTDKERAAAGVSNREALGAYDAKNKIVQISMQAKRPDAVAVHELWHAARDAGLANEQEARVLARDMPRLRRFLETMFPGKDWVRQPDHEIEAYAMQAYWQAKQAGVPVSLHIGARRVFQRFFDFTNRLWSAAHGDGFQMPEDIFGNFAAGGWKARAQGASQMPNLDGRAPSVGASDFNPIHRSGRDAIIEHMQDLSRPVKRLQEEFEGRRGSAFSDVADFYASKRLYIGRMTAQSRDFERDHVKPFFEAIKASGMTRAEVSQAIYAQAAPERNAYIASINPAFPDGGSGMTNADAAQIMADLRANPEKYAAFQSIARRFAAMRDFDLDNRVAQGLMSQEQADEWRQAFPNYAPMRGFDIPREGEDGPRFPSKFDVWGKESKQALGRKSKADDPLSNMIQQVYQGIDRGERNHYLQALYRALNMLKRDGVDVSDIVKITKSEPYKYISDATGKVTTGYRPIDKASPDVVTLKIGGREISMKFHDPELAAAIQRMKPDDVGWMANKILTIQNQIKSIWTHYSPDFLIRHFLFRYPIEGMLNFQELKDVSDQASTLRFIKDTFASVGDLMKVLHGGQGSAKYDAYIREMREQGGIVEFRQMQSLDLIKHDLERALKDISATHQKFRDAREAFDRLTNAMDNAIRLANYIQHREAGFTPKQAALKARDATIDYMLKGRAIKKLGLFFPFFNVAGQTGHRFYSAGKRSPAMRRTIATMLLAGAALALWNYWAGGTDKRGKPNIEAVPEWERRMNLLIMNPFDKDSEGRSIPIKIPLPYSFAMVNFTGGNLVSEAMRLAGIGTIGTGKAAASQIRSAIEAFTPFGEEDSFAAKLVPEIARPIIHNATNQKWTGSPVYREAPRFPGQPVPANSEQGGFNVEGPYKAFAKGINAATGGSAYRSGAVDMHPEQVKEFVDHFFGAQIRIGERVADIGQSVIAKAQGVTVTPPDRTDIPLLRVINGQNYDASDRGAYYDERAPAYAAENEVKGLAKSGDSAGAAAALKTHQEDFEAASIFHAADHQRAAIYKQIELLEKRSDQSSVQKQQEYQRLRQQELGVMNRAREELNALRASYTQRKQ